MRELTEIGIEDLPYEPPPVFDQPSVPLPVAVAEAPEPVISYPSNWTDAAKDFQGGPYESDLPWNPIPADTLPVESPTYVFSKDENMAVYPKELEPAYVRGIDMMPTQPSYEPSPVYGKPLPVYDAPKIDYEVPKMAMQPVNNTTCQCVAYPCDCDNQPVETPPIYLPPPIVTSPIVTPAPAVLPVNTPVTTPPPIVNVTTPTTQQAASAADETALIFGYPWYYVAGAAAVALFALSSMDGKK